MTGALEAPVLPTHLLPKSVSDFSAGASHVLKGIDPMAISAAQVKELREKTGAGMMDCKAALNENDGDMEAAIDWLRKKGIAKADKKSARTAADGLVGVAVSGTKAAVVEVNAETDFVARNEGFQTLVRGIANTALMLARQDKSAWTFELDIRPFGEKW